MIARKALPAQFVEFNQRHKAPLGPRVWRRLANSPSFDFIWRRRLHLPSWMLRAIGPFGMQQNSLTRTVEYPWAFYAADLKPGMKVVDIGAGVAGLQFVLSAAGADVTNVDPLINPDGSVEWTFSDAEFDKLNRSLGSRVTFVRKFLQDAKLPENSVDRVFAISVIEHIPEDAACSLMAEIGRVLKPGGKFIGTVDLFFDLKPFTGTETNKWGSNVPVKKLADASGLELSYGDRRELYGYAEFDPAAVKARADEFYTFNGVAAQCIVLTKPVR